MTNETLKMQMLAGIITESEYKAKLQENKVATKKKPLKEHFIGMGAINSPFMEREKEVYEDAFEHFLDGKYGLNENEEMVDSNMLKSYLDQMISLADDMEYTSEMVDELENLKNTLSDRSMSKEEALKIMQKTIDITGDEIDAAEALNQAISGDYGLGEGKEVEEPSLYEEEVNEGKLDGLYMELKDVLFPYYTNLRGEERVSMIDDVIKELNSYISILQNEKRAKQ